MFAQAKQLRTWIEAETNRGSKRGAVEVDTSTCSDGLEDGIRARDPYLGKVVFSSWRSAPLLCRAPLAIQFLGRPIRLLV